MSVILTRDLVKKFGELTAVDGVNLAVEERECFGLLGPNGAGKTSLLRMVTGVSPPTSGKIWVLGSEMNRFARDIKGRLGVVPQIDNLDPDLTVMQNLVTFGRYFDISAEEARRRSAELLGLFQLDDKRDSRINQLSGGMKRRLMIARGLINRPKVLVLDEPTVGLDPQSKYLVWQKLRDFKAQGVAQVLCTQNMDEAASLCDRVSIMNKGKFLATDLPERLVEDYVGSEMWEIEAAGSVKESIVSRLKERSYEFENLSDRVHVFHVKSGDADSLKELATSAVGHRRRPGTLEDVFFRLTGRTLGE
jgi:lipooligosaccharide transport system ATP-binding protein